MNMPAIFSSVPGILQQPGTLQDIILGAQYLLSVDSVLVPNTHPLLLLVVNGGHISRLRRARSQSEISVINPEALRRWLNLVWFPLQQAALENDTEAYFSAEVSLLCTGSELQGPHVSGCMLWASLAALHFAEAGSRYSKPADHIFRVALRAGAYLMSAEHTDGYRPVSEWRAALLPASDTLQEADIFAPGWLDAFMHRAERVFTCAHRRLGTTYPLLSVRTSARFVQGGPQ